MNINKIKLKYLTNYLKRIVINNHQIIVKNTSKYLINYIETIVYKTLV